MVTYSWVLSNESSAVKLENSLPAAGWAGTADCMARRGLATCNCCHTSGRDWFHVGVIDHQGH